MPNFAEMSWKSSFVLLCFSQVFAFTETVNTSFQKASGDVVASSVSSCRNNDSHFLSLLKDMLALSSFCFEMKQVHSSCVSLPLISTNSYFLCVGMLW